MKSGTGEVHMSPGMAYWSAIRPELVVKRTRVAMVVTAAVSRSEVLGRFYSPNTTPKDKERVVICLCSTGQELH